MSISSNKSLTLKRLRNGSKAFILLPYRTFDKQSRFEEEALILSCVVV